MSIIDEINNTVAYTIQVDNPCCLAFGESIICLVCGSPRGAGADDFPTNVYSIVDKDVNIGAVAATHHMTPQVMESLVPSEIMKHPPNW